MTEPSKKLLIEMQGDVAKTACCAETFGGTTVLSNEIEFGKGDREEGLRYKDAMYEIVNLGFARWISDECIELTSKGLDWRPYRPE